MKVKNPLYLAVLLFCLYLFAAPTLAAELEWNGYFETETRLGLENSSKLTWHETSLNLQPEVNTNNAHFYGKVSFRDPGVTFANISNPNQILIELEEAYLDLYAIPWQQVDIRLGKQLIPWGTGYLLNPTNNLNPEDLRDLFDFGRHLGSNTLKVTSYLGEVNCTGIYIPTFTPAALPENQQFQSLLYPEIPILPFEVNKQTTEILLPPKNLGESNSWGLKLEKSILGCDFSISYVDGRYTLPVPKITLTPAEEAQGKVDLLCELIYPQRKVIGFDLAGAYGGLGFWGEVAFFFPEEVKTTSDLSSMIGQKIELVTLEDTPYTKYLIGFDYSINNLYFNGQYLHGFPQERGDKELANYLVGRLEFTLLDGKFKIPFNTCLEVRNFNKFSNTYAFIFSPEIYYYPEMNTEIILSLQLIDGKPKTALGKLKDLDTIGLKVKYSF